MESDLIPIDDFFVEKARGNPSFLKEIMNEAIEELEAGDYRASCGMLKTYILASNKTSEVADFLNCSKEELLQQLNDRAINKKEHLEKIKRILH